MAWEWSHTPEAYANVRAHIERLPRTTCLTVLREWQHHAMEQNDAEDAPAPTFRLRPGVRALPTDIMREQIAEETEMLRTCDNGGHAAWICPYGCHTVPFDAPKGYRDE